jgi:cystathionine beta-synthase
MRENRMLGVDPISVRHLIERKGGRHPPLVSVAEVTTVRQALDLMQRHGITQVPVLESGDCVGSVAEGQLLGRVMTSMALLDRPVAEVMGAPFPVVHARDSLEQATRLLARGNDAVLVREGGELTGVVTRIDIVGLLGGR